MVGGSVIWMTETHERKENRAQQMKENKAMKGKLQKHDLEFEFKE